MGSSYRLGLDLGSNSIGWCAVPLAETEKESARPRGVLAAGVRILTPNAEAGRDPQSKNSLAADRRAARGARRRRQRFLRRRARLMECLIEAGLMPRDRQQRKALERLDPYYLRAAALDAVLTPEEIGRALFHLNQRRGFQSNRLADGEKEEQGAMKTGMRALEEALEGAGARTLGEYLAARHDRDREGRRLDPEGTAQPVRFRPRREGAKTLYDLYPARWLVEQELEAIWRAQAPHHPTLLTDTLLARLKRLIIDQRPLKKPVVGRCSQVPQEDERMVGAIVVDWGERAPKAHPLFQRFRILQDVSQLRIAVPGGKDRPLTLAERDAVAAKLMSASAARVPFETLRKAAKLASDARFNYELSGGSGFQTDQTAAKLGAKKILGKRWRALPRAEQIAIVERLLGEPDPDRLIADLQASCGLSADEAQAAADARLPQRHGAFGRAALAALVEAMETETREAVDPASGEVFQRPLTYNEAVEAALGRSHSDLAGGRGLRRLPYYGEALTRHVVAKPDAPEGSQERIGRVANPTVHIALNQLRRIVNALIEEYGPPAEIVIELGRELKLNREKKDALIRENRENEKKNLDRLATLEKLGVADSPDARMRLRLFEELPAEERVCVFSGEPIALERLFTGAIEIEHILPFSKTLDDGFMNKALATRAANREKGNHPPAEAWSGARLAEIAERARRILPKKAWRFQPDAMERFDEVGGFLDRQLTDSQYMARLAKTYLESVCDQVWAPPGRLTAMLRGKWGLNSLLPDHNIVNTAHRKNRLDHRHHAIDAFVIACTDRGLLNRMARASAQAEEMDLDRLFPKEGFPEPFEGYRETLRAALDAIIVSHKPDHGLPPGAQGNVHVTSGRLHEATAYGAVEEEIDGKTFNLVFRKPLDGLSVSEIDRIRDRRLRETLQARLVDAAAAAGETKASDATRRQMLADFAAESGIRRVRVLKREASTRRIEHRDTLGRAHEKHVTPGDNHRIEIFALPAQETGGGAGGGERWMGEGVTVFDANRPDYRPGWRAAHPGARLVMRVHNGDLIEADFGAGRIVYRVYRLEAANNRLRLAPHNEAGQIDARHNDPADPLRWTIVAYSRLQEADARRVVVDPLGRVRPVVERE